MKKTFLAAGVFLIVLSAGAQNKLTPFTRNKALEYMELKKQPGHDVPTLTSLEENGEEVVVFINLSQGATLSDLEKIDYVTVLDRFPTSILASVPVDRLLDLSQQSCIRRVEIGQKATVGMNYARPSGQVDAVQAGFDHNGSQISFDGSGVVLGMMDIGLEANHLNFLNEDGTSRIKRLWWMRSNNGSSTAYTDENIRSFTTDDTGESHATHVAGIMGGNYKGPGTYAYMPSPTSASPEMRKDAPVPYYGVATGADLALNVGQLYTPNIVQGIRNVIEYAESLGKPAVVNLSLGLTVGPHDGTDAYTSAISDLGKRGIICISAGNDGDANISIVKDITSETGNNSVLRTFMKGNSDDVINGQVDLWGTDNTVLAVQWGIYTLSTRTFTPFISITEAGQSFSSASNPNFNRYFNGSVTASAWIDSNNNRFNAGTTFSSVSAKDSDHAIALYVSGAKTGQKLYLYSSTANMTFSYRPSASASIVDGYTNGSPSNSINNLACAENVISVGAYVSRTTYGILREGYYYPAPAELTLEGIAYFSSYGKAFDGTQLPKICAPGSRIISSFSRYYVSENNSADNMVAKAQNGSNTDYWGNMQGTSMACPFVSGTVGLWLEAKPELTYSDVMDIITQTSSFNSLIMRPRERWGAGKINALEGIRYILQKYAANGAVWEDDDRRLLVSFNGSGYDVTMAGEARFTVTVYDIQGRPVATARGLDGQASVTTSELTPGVYVLAAQGASSRLTRKVTVR